MPIVTSTLIADTPPKKESSTVLQANSPLPLNESDKSHLPMWRTDMYLIANLTANKGSTFWYFMTDNYVLL